MTMVRTAAFEVARDDLTAVRLARGQLDADALTRAGKVLLAVDRFALTANNVTYAAYGEAMSYWAFFPATEGYGLIPVWGFADVVASGHAEIAVGERVYGYFPMASHLVVEPTRVQPARFVDGAAHRQPLPAVYNSYERIAPARAADRAGEPAEMLLRPLAITSWLIADFLADNGFFGARQVLVSSASSKTSLGLGFFLKNVAGGAPAVGLTSAKNRTFVERTGCFDRLAVYDDLSSLDPAVPTVFVDMAGSVDVITSVHGHFRDALVYSCRVGATHWRDKASRLDVPGAKPVFFFAPAQIRKRAEDWGPGGLESRFGSDFQTFAAASRDWLKVEETRDASAVPETYSALLAGKVAPDRGLIVSMRVT